MQRFARPQKYLLIIAAGVISIVLSRKRRLILIQEGPAQIRAIRQGGDGTMPQFCGFVEKGGKARQHFIDVFSKRVFLIGIDIDRIIVDAIEAAVDPRKTLM